MECSAGFHPVKDRPMSCGLYCCSVSLISSADLTEHVQHCATMFANLWIIPPRLIIKPNYVYIYIVNWKLYNIHI